jgi:tRNA1Val (adenine37-N6)-methyltransferase
LLTRDSLFSGKLVVYQEKSGYRFSVDAVLLAGLGKVRAEDRVVELGTGCGVVLLILAFRGLGRSLLGIEIQPELIFLARRNVEENAMGGRIDLIEADLRSVPQLLPPQSCDVVLCNPPYRRLSSGRVNPNKQRAIARHELTASLPNVFRAANHLLPEGGRLGIIYPASRLENLLVKAHDAGFCAKELTVVFSHGESPARLVFLQFTKGGGEELHVAPPFFIYDGQGGYSESMQRMYED